MASGGAGAGCAPRAGHQASPPLLAAPGPRPRRGARAERRAGAAGAAGQISCSAAGGAGAAAGGGARTPRSPRVPTTLLRARRGRRGAPEGGGRAHGRCGAAAAAGSARPDRPPRGERAWGADRGPRARGGRSRPGTPPRPPPRERPRRGAGSPSPVPAGPRRVRCQRQGTARPRPSGPGPPQPNLATRLAALAFPLGKRTRGACVSAGGDGAGGTATVRTRVKAGETERGVPSGCVGGCRTQGSRRDGCLWRKRLRVAPTPEGRALLSRRPLPSQGGERSGMPLGAQRCGRECGGSGQAPLAQAGPQRQRGDLSEFLGQRAVQRQARGLPGTIWERPDNPLGWRGVAKP